MIEEIITSGRMNPEIDPLLHIWGWEISLYLYIGGLVAGILFFSALLVLLNKEDKFTFSVKMLPLSAPVLLGIGLLALFLDLSHKLYFWRLYTIIRLNSPMSWGAWTLMAIFPLSVLWCCIWLKDNFTTFKWPYTWLDALFETGKKYRKLIAWMLVGLSLILGMYTGILLSAFNARPFWNTSILGPLFLVSGLSTGAAAIILFSKNRQERRLFSKVDMALIGVELFFIIHLFMGFLAGVRVHIQAAELFLGGPYTAPFWIFVVSLGLILPALLEFLELKQFKIPHVIPAVMVLFGGLLLRIIVVSAGQASRWLY
ncbi:MAG: polysulfide reductase NrfD [FCB group bacterium]|nr:polysulfide reductase NrfD [FCB group bacterium]